MSSAVLLGAVFLAGCAKDPGELSSSRTASTPAAAAEPVAGAVHAPFITKPPGSRAQADGSEPLHPGGGVTEPFAIVSVLPDCRALAGAPIPVAVELVVTREGTVRSARILSAVPDSAKALVLESVRGWRFRPATLNGGTVAVTWTVAMKCA